MDQSTADCFLKLIELIHKYQRIFSASGERKTRQGVNQSLKVVEAFSRLLNLNANCVCVALCLVEYNSNEVLLAAGNANEDKLLKEKDFIFENIEQDEIFYIKYIQILQKNISNKKKGSSVNGYASFSRTVSLSRMLTEFLKKCDLNSALYSEILKKAIEKMKIIIPIITSDLNKFIDSFSKTSQTSTTEQATLLKLLLIKMNDLVSIFKNLKLSYVTNDNQISENQSLCNLIEINEHPKVISSETFTEIITIKTEISYIKKFYNDLQTVKKYINIIPKNLITIKSTSSNVHAEMQILEHLFNENNQFNNIPPEKIIIGTSKLACECCFQIIQLLNTTKFKNIGNISIRGVHGKVYKKWHYPNFMDAKMLQQIIVTLTKMLQEGLLFKKKINIELSESLTNSRSSLHSSIEKMEVLMEDTVPTNTVTIIDLNTLKQNLEGQKIKEKLSEMITELLDLQKEYITIPFFDEDCHILIDSISFKIKDLIVKENYLEKMNAQIEHWKKNLQ